MGNIAICVWKLDSPNGWWNKITSNGDVDMKKNDYDQLDQKENNTTLKEIHTQRWLTKTIQRGEKLFGHCFDIIITMDSNAKFMVIMEGNTSKADGRQCDTDSRMSKIINKWSRKADRWQERREEWLQQGTALSSSGGSDSGNYDDDDILFTNVT